MQIHNNLQHYGVKGMKWGVRRYQNKNGTTTSVGKQRRKAENYSTKQRIRDRKIYGKGAESRINKRMLKGESIQSARHNEVERKARIDTGKKIAKTVTKGVLVVGGTVAVSKLLSKYGNFSLFDKGVITETVINTGKHIVNAILR